MRGNVVTLQPVKRNVYRENQQSQGLKIAFRGTARCGGRRGTHPSCIKFFVEAIEMLSVSHKQAITREDDVAMRTGEHCAYARREYRLSCEITTWQGPPLFGKTEPRL